MKPFLGLLNDITKYNVTNKPVTILEIGVHKGLSTHAFLTAIDERRRKGKLYSIDIRESQYFPPEHLKQYWEFISGDSRKIKWEKPIDILSIDGNHRYHFVKNDYQHFEPFVSDGGFILLHDVTNLKYEVYKFWEEIEYNNKIILDMGRNGLGVVVKDKKI